MFCEPSNSRGEEKAQRTGRASDGRTAVLGLHMRHLECKQGR